MPPNGTKRTADWQSAQHKESICRIIPAKRYKSTKAEKQKKQKSRKKRPGGRFLLLFIREFEAVVLLFVFDLEGEAEEEGEDSE